MVEEYDSIVRNSVWDLVLRPDDKSAVRSHWIYKVKQDANGSVEKHKMGWSIHQMDVKTTFLNGMIEDEGYIEKLEGFETLDSVSHVHQLKRALFGLKQAHHAWYTRIDSYFTGLGLTKSEADVNLYHIVVEGKILIIVLYVDDLILTSDEKLIKSYNEDLTRELQIKDMGLMHYCLGMEV
eukprot:PITA_36001